MFRRRLVLAVVGAAAVAVAGLTAAPASSQTAHAAGLVNLLPQLPGLGSLLDDVLDPVTDTVDGLLGTDVGGLTDTVTDTVDALAGGLTGGDQQGQPGATTPPSGAGAPGTATPETPGRDEAKGRGKAGTGGGSAGPGRAQAPTTPEPAPAGPPIAGTQASTEHVAGVVTVRTAKGWQPVRPGSAVPYGAIVDTRAGAVQVAAVTDGDTGRAALRGGLFSLDGDPDDAATIRLRGGGFSDCRPADAITRRRLITFARTRSGRSAAARRRARRRAAQRRRARKVRRLWATADGDFRTAGRWGAATVRGTTWLTEDRCGGTLVTVREGAVEVSRLDGSGKSLVRAGERRLVRRR